VFVSRDRTTGVKIYSFRARVGGDGVGVFGVFDVWCVLSDFEGELVAIRRLSCVFFESGRRVCEL
jgi:hypothetical protein